MNYIIDKINIPEICSHVKIDVGLSYGAPHSHVWLSREPHLMVFGFEPNPDAAKAIFSADNKKRHPEHSETLSQKFITDGRFQMYDVALSNVDKEEQMKFYVSKKDCGTSSLFLHDEKYLGPIEKTIDVSVVSLKMFFDKFPWNEIEYIDYVKIDAQGSDLNILRGAGDYLQQRVVYVTAEPDDQKCYESNDCNTKNIQEYMESQGFIMVKHQLTKDPTFLNKKFEHLKDKIFIYQAS